MSNRILLSALILITAGAIGLYATGKNAAPGWMGNNMTVANRMHMGGGGMNEMMKEMMGGVLPPGFKRADLPEPNGEGAGLLGRFCTQCHDLPSPVMHTAEEWRSVTERMFKRMSMMSGMGGMGMMMRVETPSEQERQGILKYLISHSLKPLGASTLPEPATAGAAPFTRVCSQCHSLPDIELHKAGEWKDVVERMRLNMRSMDKRGITDGEASEIAGYLARHSPK